jgi:hypothetical protein
MNKVSGADVRRLLKLFLLKARLKGCFLPVLVITFHVFVFMVFSSLDSGSA